MLVKLEIWWKIGVKVRNIWWKTQHKTHMNFVHPGNRRKNLQDHFPSYGTHWPKCQLHYLHSLFSREKNHQLRKGSSGPWAPKTGRLQVGDVGRHPKGARLFPTIVGLRCHLASLWWCIVAMIGQPHDLQSVVIFCCVFRKRETKHYGWWFRNPANHMRYIYIYIKPWDKLPINWCRISSIHSIQ